jgi:hypothetical protein
MPIFLDVVIKHALNKGLKFKEIFINIRFVMK